MRNWFLLFVAVLSLAVVSGCYNQVEGKAPDTAKPEAKAATEEVLLPVQVELPKRASISAYFETTSRVVAENRVEVLSKGMGQCLSVQVEEGDEVKEGQVLAELDKQELDARLRQSRVGVEQQKAAFEIAQQSLEQGIGAKAERDNARFAFEQAKAALELLEVQIKNQTITAPISGIVTRRNIQQGATVSTGIPAFSIVDPTSFILPINAPEKELKRLQVGQVAKVAIDSLPDKEFVAHVRRINPNVDPMSGTVKVTLDFDTESRQYLRDSAFARVRLIMETHENVIVVPKDAIVEENARSYLLLVKDQAPAAGAASDKPMLVADRVEVQTGLEDGTSMEIVSGIDDNARVVTLGQHTLKPGTFVVITNAQTQLDAKANLNPEQVLSEAAKAKEQEAKAQEAKGS